MELNRDQLEQVDALALSNTVLISALVGLLVQKGVLTHDELTAEIRRIRARLKLDEAGGVAAPPEEG